MMKKLQKIVRKIPINLTRFVLLIVIAGTVILLNSSRTTVPKLSTNIASLCNLNGLNYGTDTLSLHIGKTGTYTFWAHVESPVPISYNVLPQQYNPFFVTVDSQKCFKLGGVSDMPVNTWVWINYQNGNVYDYLKLNLTAGNHVISMAGTDMSVDRVMVIPNNCIPSGDGSNCVSEESQSFDHQP